MLDLPRPNRRPSLRRVALTGFALAAAFIASSTPSLADPGNIHAQLRAATARYHSVDQALADGFLPTEDCVELPGFGGMGYHFANPRRLAAEGVDPARPSILLYVKDGHGRLRLAGAEWFTPDPDQDLATEDGRPTLFGQPFDGPMPGHGPGMPIHFDLHVWIWQDNPTGMFQAWNPTVTCGS